MIVTDHDDDVTAKDVDVCGISGACWVSMQGWCEFGERMEKGRKRRKVDKVDEMMTLDWHAVLEASNVVHRDVLSKNRVDTNNRGQWVGKMGIRIHLDEVNHGVPSNTRCDAFLVILTSSMTRSELEIVASDGKVVVGYRCERSDPLFCVLTLLSSGRISIDGTMDVIHAGPAYLLATLDMHDLGEGVKRDQPDVHFVNLLDLLHPRDEALSEMLTAEYLFDRVSHAHVDISRDTMDVPGLGVKLFPFQCQTVRWMLHRERVLSGDAWIDARPKQVEIFEEMEGNRSIQLDRLQGGVWSVADARQLAKDVCVRGGILADEMGLGKTMDVCALVMLHRWTPVAPAPNAPLPIGSTLVVTPASILGQWLQEVHKHAPSIRVLHYRGYRHRAISPADLAKYDIVVTDYTVLRLEVHRARHPGERVTRRGKLADRWEPSPLVGVVWWRICLDEAQMVESQSSYITEMACLLHRVNSWAVSGTPIRKNIASLESIIKFLRVYPFHTSPKLWKRVMLPKYAPLLVKLVTELAHRHTKEMVQADVILPPQRSFLIPVEFTKTERWIYDDLIEQYYQESAVSMGNDRKETRTEKMHSWLLRLRQTCCYPQMGDRGKGRISSIGRVKTIAEIQEVLELRALSELHSAERSVCTSKLRLALVLDAKRTFTESAAIYVQVYNLAQCKVAELKKKLVNPPSKLSTGRPNAANDDLDDFLDERDEKEALENVLISGMDAEAALARIGLMHWQDIVHRAAFFAACSYHELKDDVNEKLYYELADKCRHELLVRTRATVQRVVSRIKLTTSCLGHIRKDLLEDLDPILCRQVNVQDNAGESDVSCVHGLKSCLTAIDMQASALMRIRTRLVDLLMTEVFDLANDPSGEEYERSLKMMEEIDELLAVYSSGIQDRMALLYGANSRKARIDLNMSKAMKRILSNEERVDVDAFLKESTRDEILYDSENNLHHCLTRISQLRPDSGPVGRTLIDYLFKRCCDLQSEALQLNNAYNTRVVYYRRLQQLSDSVTAPDIAEADVHDEMQLARSELEKVELDLVRAMGRHRYISNALKDESAEQDFFVCFICRSDMEKPVITTCGHRYCFICLEHWLRVHKSCPICRFQIRNGDLTRIQDTSLVNTTDRTGFSADDVSALVRIPLYPHSLGQVASFVGFGSKIDALVKLLKRLDDRHLGCKTLLFSQWESVLDVVGKALKHNSIKFVRFAGASKSEQVIRFNQDPDVSVFMLHSKSQSSGLTLIAATNVVLFEPMANEALEKQAISRIHRIGQTKETNVFRFYVRGTVEESILTSVDDRDVLHPLHQSYLTTATAMENFVTDDIAALLNS